MSFADNAACVRLYGEHNVNLSRIEKRLNVRIDTRGNEVLIDGSLPDDVHAAAAVLEDLYAKLMREIDIDVNEVDAAVRMIRSELTARAREAGEIRTFGRPILPRTPNQIRYKEALERYELVFALGPAGTGKTYLAVAMAAQLLRDRRVERLVLSRPAVEAGERLGFLPGTLEEKVDPYLRPLYDALHDMLPRGKVQERMERGDIEIAPLAYMRGRTLSNACIILDEAQNTTPAQMKMFLTRFGENSRMIVTGDPSQSDLPPGAPSGLRDAVERLANVEEIGIVRLERDDVVRHPLVMQIIDAYDDPAAAVSKEALNNERKAGRLS